MVARVGIVLRLVHVLVAGRTIWFLPVMRGPLAVLERLDPANQVDLAVHGLGDRGAAPAGNRRQRLHASAAGSYSQAFSTASSPADAPRAAPKHVNLVIHHGLRLMVHAHRDTFFFVHLSGPGSYS